MDGQQFDRLVRALGSGRSRRSVVKGIAAGLFGVVAGAKVTEQASATIVCGVQSDMCSVDGEGAPLCCEGFVCTQVLESFFCQEVVTCSWWGEDCTEAECCDGLVCSSAGTCANEVGACAGGYERCEYQEGDVYVTCCDGLICAETGKGELCVYCAPVGESCEYDPCCSGLTCGDDLVCAPPPVLCAAEGASCAEVGCCDALTCLDTTICGYPTEPGPDPDPEPKPIVPVYQLPDTGAGAASDAMTWVAPAALGAAAAVIGSKLIKGEQTGT
jgi:hypothetical protein